MILKSDDQSPACFITNSGGQSSVETFSSLGQRGFAAPTILLLNIVISNNQYQHLKISINK